MDAIPLAPQPNLAHYKKLAKELAKATGEPAALRAWAVRWLESLAAARGAVTPEVRARVESAARQVELRVGEEAKGRWSLAAAQWMLARLHAFESWASFARHVEELALRTNEAARFEAAAVAVVDGDVEKLRAVLRDDPELIRARSNRRHQSTLLHYVAANGIEDFRQRTPANVVEVAQVLLAAGAEVDAAHGGPDERGTALGLVATSSHTRAAGVQLALMELLVAAGAAVDGLPGGWAPIRAALANGCPEAAEWLAERGARMDLVSAAGAGRRELLERSLAAAGTKEREEAFIFACVCGRTAVAELLLDRGVDIAASNGQTGLHLATHAGKVETVKMLLARGAPLEIENRYGGTVLDQALWSAVHNRDVDYQPIIDALIAAGARIDPAWSTGIAPIDEALRRDRS